MPKKQEYYKVLIVENNKLYSAMKPVLGEYALQYYIHRPVTAKIGGILVFTDVEAAWSFAGIGNVIYRCTVSGEMPLPDKRLYLSTSNVDYLIPKIWQRQFADVAPYDLATWPGYTKTFRTITLRERVR